MVQLQSQEHGENSNTEDPSDQVMDKDRNKGYLRLHERDLARKVAQHHFLVLSQIKAANLEIILVIPDFGAVPRVNSIGDKNGRSASTRLVFFFLLSLPSPYSFYSMHMQQDGE